ncbi:MAG: anaerobic ribonucleoside-triphosphate reductase activating protein [Elusimicrobia bacterium RIFOXYA12_FULL_51_18]|nr:MAG: anaerobic ribonucleoside-triphosphate reductase activating protein [Elusimicrobia bacterium RIFOXYA12_FULL_51_18]OGS30973.1 MAG: anaerobic ribonucleoside-triphosphate reductase activating protein [Elusimicrobia bacterium RIFOXYA2_FULL_53_38]
MKIRAALNFNLIDYPGKIAAMVFAPGCNYSCPACHAKPLFNEDALVDEEDFFKYLDNVRQWVNGVVICGGEPTMQDGLIQFIRRLKTGRLSVKLDTNGGAPDILNDLLAEDLVDYVAMDVKGPKHLWASIAGRPDAAAAMMESMRVAARFPDHEFRTTIVPVLRGEDSISFLTVPEAEATARLIVETTGSGGHKYYIQKFVPRRGGLLDARLESFPETPPELLEDMKRAASKFLPKCEIRG